MNITGIRLLARFLGLLAVFTTVTPDRVDAAPPYYHPLSPPKYQTADELAPIGDAVFRNAAFRAANSAIYGRTDPPVTPVTMYAEWAPVTHVYYVWYPGQHDNFFYGIADAIMQHGGGALVSLIVEDAAHQTSLQNEISSQGGNLSLVEFVNVSGYPYYGSYPTDSYWTVDYGPYWVLDGAGNLGIADPRYYETRTNDDAIPTKLADMLGVNVWRPDLNFEGGNLTSDGAGTCFASRAHQFHNLPLLPYQVDEILWDYYGCEKTIWLEPLDGESTGHHDMFSKMLTPTTWIMGEYTAAQDPVNATILNDNAALLASETTAGGQPINVVRIPMPDQGSQFGWTVWRTYTNSIIVNNVVIVPTYANETSHEAAALAVYQSVLPGHTIIGLDSDAIIPEGGAVHCVTRTRPAATVAMIEAAPADICGGDWDCPPTSGCGDIDFTGVCIGNTSVYCSGGNLQQQQCTGNEVCGWDAVNGYIDCVPAGCGAYTASGTCETDGSGVELAVWCDGTYPRADRCAPTESCGMDATLGRVACLGACADECSVGDVGCSADLAQSWTCGEAGDGDTCLERIYTSCPGGTSCQNGTCTCIDECSAGDVGCSTDGSQRWTCGEAGDGDTCLEEVYVACGSDETCVAGACECTDECSAGDTGCSADGSQRWTCAEAGDGDTCLDRVYADCDPGTPSPAPTSADWAPGAAPTRPPPGPVARRATATTASRSSTRPAAPAISVWTAPAWRIRTRPSAGERPVAARPPTPGRVRPRCCSWSCWG
jgi:agmatine/peptidylarginine deiminase